MKKSKIAFLVLTIAVILFALSKLELRSDFEFPPLAKGVAPSCLLTAESGPTCDYSFIPKNSILGYNVPGSGYTYTPANVNSNVTFVLTYTDSNGNYAPAPAGTFFPGYKSGVEGTPLGLNAKTASFKYTTYKSGTYGSGSDIKPRVVLSDGTQCSLSSQLEVKYCGLPASRQYKRAFISSGQYQGNLNSYTSGFTWLAGVTPYPAGPVHGDFLCQDLADKANLGGWWEAWLSTSNQQIKNRFRNYKYVDYFALDSTKLTDFASGGANGPWLAGKHLNATRLDEKGITYSIFGGVNYDNLVWTNTTETGSYNAANGNCSDWTSNSSSVTGGYGFPTDVSNPNWTNAGPTYPTCNKYLRLYCVEQ